MPTFAQQLTVAGLQITGVPDDWTHHHLLFSNPGAEAEAIANGTHDRWISIVNDPRYILQQLHRGQGAQGPSGAAVDRILGSAKGAPATAQVTPVAAPASQKSFAALAHRTGPPVSLSPDHSTLASSDFSMDLGLGLTDIFNDGVSWNKRMHKDWSMNIGAGAQGLTAFPAKYSFSATTASCANDYVTFGTGSLGTSTQATITAYKNLYAGCGGTVPAVDWQYNTAGGNTFHSPVLSLDGSQVAFMQAPCASGCTSSLVILKWASSPAVVSLSSTAATAYRACAAPCMAMLALGNGGFDGFSSPFYDYSGDTIYVGDNSGALHKFTGVFNGTPAEVTTSPWPVVLNASYYLAPPVLDHVSNKIFVGTEGTGFYYSVNASTGAITGASAQIGYVYGIWDGPLVDSSAQMTYVFSANDGQSNCYDSSSAVYGCSAVFQFPTGFTSLANSETQVFVGYYPLLAGAFDNIYFNSSSSNPTGHLYTLGETDYDFVQTLSQVPITGNAMGAQSYSPYYLGDGYPGSAVTEFYNSSTAQDYIFVSLQGAYQGCTQNSGCVFGFNVTSGAVPSAPTAATIEAGGTSGVVIDNASALSGASQIYFTTLSSGTCATSGGTGLCAVQTSQAAP